GGGGAIGSQQWSRGGRVIPLVDLKAQHRQVANEVVQGISGVMEGAGFILGKEVAEFEKAFAGFVGVKHCIGVANGTDALELVLRAANIGAGHEVILPANTFIATALAVARAGATPVLVDVDPVFHLMDPGDVEARITSRTRAIMPVHLYGQIAPMAALKTLADKHQLLVLEDAAQAQGAKQHGVSAGRFGLAAGTSFYPGKNLGAYGDAGGVITDSDEMASRIRALRNYGSEVKYHHPEVGFNSRLDTLQAVVLLAKLKRLDAWNAQRREAATRYDALLKDVRDVVRPATLEGNEHIWHLYVVRVPGRDAVLKSLNEAGVGAGVHYPVPVHLQGAFKSLGHARGDFPVTERAAQEILSLPMYGEITAPQQEQVVAALKKALAR
ncbi:MAG: DegT/DnrJ/EryC1/StrS family aminotransferase, partial [Myxococcaceae bacterium]